MKILLLNQCFYPDVVSTAQHLTDFAVEMAARGHQVTVIASRHGYDDPEMSFPRREVWKNIDIIRLPSFKFGKAAKWRRALDFGSFIAGCILRLIFLPRFDVVLAMTSPPLISFLGALFVRLKGGRFVFWVMDLNPDEAIAAGWLKAGSLTAKLFDQLLRFSLRHAVRVFVLDRFMERRVMAKGVPEEKLAVIPPWSHDDVVKYQEEGRLAFRERYDLSDRFVVMYSGNHSPCHPLDTILEAAARLTGNPEITFCFVGGGSEYIKVKEFVESRRLQNAVCLPYQPLEKLAASLSAADLHLVVMGDAFPGIVHTCKIYNILAIGAPFLYIGPTESHIADILTQIEGDAAARAARHGEVDVVVKHIVEGVRLARKPKSQSALALGAKFSKQALLWRMVNAVESVPEMIPARAAGTSETNVHSV